MEQKLEGIGDGGCRTGAEYSSKYPGNAKWFFGGSQRMVKKSVGTDVCVELSNTRIIHFTDNGNQTYSPKQLNLKVELKFLDAPDCRFEFKDCDGWVYWFEETGELIKQRRGNSECIATYGSPLQSQVRTTTQDGVTYENRLDYSYDGSERLIAVVSSLVNVTASTTSLLRRQVFTYYGPSESHGSDGDLKTSTIQLPDGAGGWVDHETTYMRYYKAGDADGFAHALKYLVRPEAFRRLSLVGNPLTAANSLVAQYADNYYEYDSNQRAKKSVTNGGLLTYTMAYTVSAHADAYNNWYLKTVVTRPDGATETIYSNYLTQQLLSDLSDGKTPFPNHSVNYWQYNARGSEILHAMPSAVVSYNEAAANLGVTLQATSGLSMVTDYYSSTTATVSTPGGVIDEVSATWLRKGSGGGAVNVKQSALTYYWRDTDNGFIWPVAAQTTYRDDAATDAITTSYSYTWYTDSTQILQRVATLPVITTAQNGSNTANARRELYDMYGNLQAAQDERGFINSSVYFWALNVRTKSVQDDDAPSGSGWTANSGTRLKLTSDYQYDDLGRMTQSLGPAHAVDLNGTSTTVRTTSWTIYQDAIDQVWSGQGYATGTGPSYTYTLVNPVSISVTDDAGRTTDSITATRASTSGKLLASDTFPQSTWVRWSTTQYNNQNQQTSSRSYWHIPASGTGTVNTNYYETTYGYDAMNRQNRVVNTVGTISRTVFEYRSLVYWTYVGTNDAGATDEDPSNNALAPNNMLPLSLSSYDENGNKVGVAQFANGEMDHDRNTVYEYDWRNRQTAVDGEIDVYVEQVYNNLNQVTQVNRKNTTSGGNLIGRSETFYDNLGRTYQSKVYAVDPATGTAGNALTDNTWYDPAGNVLKSKPAGSQAWTKIVYDSVGRNTIRYVGYSTATENYAEAGTISTSIVMEQTVTTYDAASNVIQSESAQRYHDAPQTGTGSQGVLNGPTGSNPKSRNSYVASYPDPIGRTQAVANYGTNDNTSFTRTATNPPRSDTVLVNSTDYNSAGEGWQTVDPAGQVTRQEFDDLGRRIKQIQNYVSCGHGSGQNITTEWTYTPHSQIATLTAVNADTGNQITSYAFGITVAGGSDFNSNDPLHTETYPDAGVVIREYNRAGQVIEVTDQNGTVHQLDYDKLGRSTADCVITLPSGIDLVVLRIETTYEVRGLPEKITQYDAATSGNVVNEVQRTYNTFNQLKLEYQAHSGAVNAGTTPKVEYKYADGSANTIRPTEMIYPDNTGNRKVGFNYGTGGGQNDKLSRGQKLEWTGASMVSYKYVGLSLFVDNNLDDDGITWTLIQGSSPNPYAGLDRFGRIIRNYWIGIDDIRYTYDRASNRTTRENMVAKAQTPPQYYDELYSYDGSNRLTQMKRGQLASLFSITNLKFEQDWGLDDTGNWQEFTEDSDGNGTNDLVQARTANPVNEITDITNSVGAAWVQPGYDAAGNMTTIPQGNEPAEGFTGVYDAWNRLVKLANENDVMVAEYSYDGLTRRVTKTTSEVRHYYYNASWQILEERVGSVTTFDRQYVWGLRYIDDCVLRDRKLTSSVQRLYALQDANWNVTSIVDNGGSAVERYSYSAYGVPTFLNPDFTAKAGSSNAWDVLFAGYKWDQESGMYQVRWRYENPNIGLWITRDPIQYKDANNLYLYTKSNPVIFTDSHGLACKIDFKCKLTKQQSVLDEAGTKVDQDCVYKCTDVKRTTRAGAVGDQNAIPIDCGSPIIKSIPEGKFITYISRRAVDAGSIWSPFTLCPDCPDEIDYSQLYTVEGNIVFKSNCSQAKCRKSCDNEWDMVKDTCDLSFKNNDVGNVLCQVVAKLGGKACHDFCNAHCTLP